MSYDGSSAKSYIRHTTEKERLDNLAFASFPEDYLPYAAAPGHPRTAAPPPYLLWGDDRRRRPAKKRKKPKCAGALLCAIALVIFAILAVVAISVYLGVVKNLFRSPVITVSGRFHASEDFSEELLNSSSSKFLETAEIYQAKVEKAFLSSSLEPAFIAARIYSFRPGLVVFFRVYLDRRKIKDEEESPPTELVRELVAQKLTADPESVHVEENEEMLSVDFRPMETARPSAQPTAKPPTEQNGHQRPPASGGVGQWRPVPIEDSVSPSFADRPVNNVGSVRSPEEIPKRNPPEVSRPPLRTNNNTPLRNPPTPVSNLDGVGSVKLLEESSVRNPQVNEQGSVRRFNESPSRPQVPLQKVPGSTEPSKKPTLRTPLLPTDRIEGVGSVRLLPDAPIETPQFAYPPQGMGSISVADTNPQIAPILLSNSEEGVGSVRLLDESPKKDNPTLVGTRVGVGHVRPIEDVPIKPLLVNRNPASGKGFVRSEEEPPTLAPFVSLVVRNRSRSEKPRNLLTRMEKGQQNSGLTRNQNIGMGSIREVIAEPDFPLPLLKEPPVFASRLLDLELENTTKSNSRDQNMTKTFKHETENAKAYSEIISAEFSVKPHSNETATSNNSDTSKFNSFENSSDSDINITKSLLSESRTEETTTQQTKSPEFKSSLENILFSHIPSTFPTSSKIEDNLGEETTTEFISTSDVSTENNSKTESSQFLNLLLNATSLSKEELLEILEKGSVSATTENSDEDIHSSIVNYSQYLYTEPHYHTVANERNGSSKDMLEFHTLEGHGFYKPNVTNTKLKLQNIDVTTQITTISESSSTEALLTTSTEELQSFSAEVTDSTTEIQLDSGTSTQTDIVQTTIVQTEQSRNSSVTGANIVSDTETTTNVTADDTSQQGKVVPQLQSDLISNDIGEEEEIGEDNGHIRDEILRHITTVHPHFNNSETFVHSCPTGSVPCNESGDGCGARCDMRKDCPNNEDEKNCTCSDLLRVMGQSQKICDGVDDCHDRSDETNCPWCPSVDYYRCPGSRTCITKDQVCDGKDDCPGAQDEKRCVSLADSSTEADSYEYRPEGYLVVRRNGQWGKLCLDSISRLQDHEKRIGELGKAVCSTLTYRNMSSAVRAQDKETAEDSYYQISTEIANNKSSSSTSIFVSTPCKRREVLKVQCKTLECGLRPSAISTQRRRIVGGRSAEGVGSWPWAAALYREGDFQCGAALINDIWLVSAGHCFYSSQHAYWTVRLGVLRRGSELPSSGEQVRKIQNIILHPQYEDIGFINDIALLKMDRPVPFSDALRPICLPSSSAEDASLWHGRRCSVVGWGKLYEIGHTFPDSLQEVRLPVISSAECQKRSIFLPAYRITPNMFCAGYDRGGRDACLGDSGGPMACQRPADGRWILLGVTSNGDGCGRPGRPGVYSQVAGFLSWIQETISSEKVLTRRTGSESTCSRGVRCRLGRCVAQARVCDGRRDCASGEDEDDC